MIQLLNEYLFYFLNAHQATPEWVIVIARFMAEAPQYFLGAAILYVLFKQKDQALYHFCMMAASVVIALMLSKLVAFAIPMDRPFVLGVGHQWMDHSPNASFPSDHATFLFTIAGASVWFNNCQWLTRFAFVLGLINGWARVCVGIHFPLDVLGALLVGYLSGTLSVLGYWLLSACSKGQFLKEEEHYS
jgi:undecaprenyl-diphosphatase